MGKIVKIKDFLNKKHRKLIRQLVKEIDQEIEQALIEGVPEQYETKTLQVTS